MSRKTEGKTTKRAAAKSAGTTSKSDEATSSKRPARAGGDLDKLGELPHSYGTDTIFLVAQEPRWLFTYWDIDISRHPGGQTFLRVFDQNGEIEAEIEVPFETRNWYIPVKVPGARYTVEIGYYRSETWKVIARSITVETPSDKVSESQGFEFATIPFHLSFQRLMENVQSSVKSGESLVHALSRLQKSGQLNPQVFPDLADARRTVLEALLGEEMLTELSSGSFSSQEIEQRIKEHLDARLNSGSSSEILARHDWKAVESSLFQTLSALAESSGAFSLSSWAAAALTSWTSAAGGKSSWSSEEFAQWLHKGESSWTGTSQSSWNQGALSSWNEEALTSWSQGALSSWAGGASETLSSFGETSREFFMHVNAEVIFYGGTDPRASVTIDGKSIVLNPDGSFRHHFIFPDGRYEIPIVATSPHGRETRSAILKFERGTVRVGQVDATPQPNLGTPMGEIS